MVVENWRDPAAWEPLLVPEGCPICQRGRPLDVLVELNASWATGGNTIPHVHMHLFPRYRDDPYRGVHVATQHSFHRTQEELEQLAAAIRIS